jgi:hypothetical protein
VRRQRTVAREQLAVAVHLAGDAAVQEFDELQLSYSRGTRSAWSDVSARRSQSTVPLTHVGVIIFRHNIANEVLLLGNVVWRDARRCWNG